MSDDKKDLVEVVRCKDCKWFGTWTCDPSVFWCDAWGGECVPDGYCYVGSKEENDGKD